MTPYRICKMAGIFIAELEASLNAKYQVEQDPKEREHIAATLESIPRTMLTLGMAAGNAESAGRAMKRIEHALNREHYQALFPGAKKDERA